MDQYNLRISLWGVNYIRQRFMGLNTLVCNVKRNLIACLNLL